MTPLQCTDARTRLLGISQAALAKELKMSQVRDQRVRTDWPHGTARLDRSERNRLIELRAWFEQAGIEFASDNEGAGGVRLGRFQA